MHFQVLLLSLILATSTSASPSPQPQPSPTPQYSSPAPPRAGYYPSTSHKPVYTAQRSRDQPPSIEEDEPYPSTSSLGTAQTTHGAEEEPQNIGFVEPIDFKNILQDVDSSSKGLELGTSSSNPLFASESKNSFSGFFGSDNKDPFADFGGGGLAAASSERSTKNSESGESTGFVDPNVNFRSLFDSSQTASNGFRPQDFLGNQDDASHTEPSRGSQTRAYPSFTYTGRKDDDDQPNRFRSSYRNTDSDEDDYSNRNSNRDSRRGGGRNDYEDSPPNNSRGNGGTSPRYNSPTPRYSANPNTEESSNRPQAAGRVSSSNPKTAESKNNPKCKKVEKTVDYQNEDYSSFTEPEADYDPSTYRGRYKRQSRTRQGRQARGNKRPMTCYVCQDEEGRYAERCSYDSNKNPDKNEYFHSSSSSFSDNGRRPSGKSDRHRRNPSLNRQLKLTEAGPTTLATVSLSSSAVLPKSISFTEAKKVPQLSENEPNKVIEKRQSGPDRYTQNFGNNNNGPRGGVRNNNRDEFDYQDQNEGPPQGNDFGLPRGYIGNNGGRVEEFDGPQYQPPSSSGGGGVGRQGGGSERGNDGDNYGFGSGDRNNNDDRDYGFGPEGSGGGDSGTDFNFGPPSDFGRESSSPNSAGGGNSGFNFDFSIPKEYDPDVQVRGNNNGGSASNNPAQNRQFDIGYDDYVKRHFPEGFGPPSSSESSSSRPSSSSSSFHPSAGPPVPSYRPRPRPLGPPERDHSFNQYAEHSPPHHSPPQYNHHGGPRGGPGEGRGVPDKEHTQPSYNFAPPPNFYNNDGPQGGFHGGDDGGGRGGEFESAPQNLNKLVENFGGRDRNRDGCHKVQKGDMSCYVCKDARGMNKEECMYSSNDPKNQRVAYHEVMEYSSDPPASILPLPTSSSKSHEESELSNNPQQSGSSQAASAISKTVISPKSSSSSTASNKDNSKAARKYDSPKTKTLTRVESTIVTSRKIHHEKNSPIDYDFDY